MLQTFHATFFVWNIGLRVRAQINVGASIVVKVRLHFILWPLYALHLLLCPPSRDDAEVHLPHRNLSEFTVVLLRLIRSLFPAGVHDLARVRKTSSVHKQSCSEFFLRIGTVFATSLPLACFWDKNWIFFRMIQMIWELSRWYRISAEGLQSVQYISGKFQRWNLSLPSLPAGV